MSHKTIDKHIGELMDNGYLFKFIRSKDDHEHLEIDSNKIYVSMVEKDPRLKWKLIKESAFFPFVLASEKSNFREALAIDCPECRTKGIEPVYSRTFRHYSKGHPFTMVETIKWECPKCSFKHKNSMKSHIAF
jgi:DNA-directed RNA polymerase subunit RPC12/RpoP